MGIAYDVISNPLLPTRIGKMTKQLVPTDEERAIAHQLGLDPARLAAQVALNSRGDSADRSPYVSLSVSELRRGDSYHQDVDPNPRYDDIQALMVLLRDKSVTAVSTTSALVREAAVREIYNISAKLLKAFHK